MYSTWVQERHTIVGVVLQDIWRPCCIRPYFSFDVLKMSILAHNLKRKTNILFLQLSVSHEIGCKPSAWDLNDRPASAIMFFHNTLSLSQLFCQRSVALPFETSVQIHWRGNCEIPPPRPQSHILWGWEECCRDNSPLRLVEFCTGGEVVVGIGKCISLFSYG